MLFWWLLTIAIIGGVLVVTIPCLITRDVVKEYLQQNGYTSAKIKALISGDNRMRIDALREYGEKETIEFKSEQGIDGTLKEGEYI